MAALYAYGLSVGKADGTFGLRDQLTVGQVVIFAGRIRSLYRTGDAEAGPGAYAAENEAAALRYLRYLQSEGVIGTELDESLSTPPPGPRWPMCWQTRVQRRPCRPFMRTW